MREIAIQKNLEFGIDNLKGKLRIESNYADMLENIISEHWKNTGEFPQIEIIYSVRMPKGKYSKVKLTAIDFRFVAKRAQT